MNLFGKEPRPTFNAELKDKLAVQIGTEVHKWLDEKDTPVEDAIEDTRKILEYHHNDNGYEIAREFEDAGYSPDPELVELLDGVSHIAHQLLNEAVKAWVIADDIKPELTEGTPVIVQYGRNKVEGIITGAYHSTAEYQVCIPSEGMSLENTNRRAIIKYENAWAIVPQPQPTEPFYCVSSSALVGKNPCEKWCGDVNCKTLVQKEQDATKQEIPK